MRQVHFMILFQRTLGQIKAVGAMFQVRKNTAFNIWFSMQNAITIEQATSEQKIQYIAERDRRKAEIEEDRSSPPISRYWTLDYEGSQSKRSLLTRWLFRKHRVSSCVPKPVGPPVVFRSWNLRVKHREKDYRHQDPKIRVQYCVIS